MTSESQADLREATARLERDLLARLGLGTGASNEQIENAHEEIQSYLEKAPSGLRSWSARQSASIDEAYALLRGDRADLAAAAVQLAGGPPARPAAAAAPADVAPAAPVPVRPVAPTTGIVTPHGGRHAMDALDDSDEWPEEEPAPVRRKTPAAARREAAAAAAARSGGINPVLRRIGLGAAALVAVAAVGFAGYQLGAPGASPAPTADPQLVAFQEQVASLMEQLNADPEDVPTLTALGNLYYSAGDYATALTWMEKVLALEPENVAGLLAYGAASYNTSDYETAEESWLKVLDLDPENLEAYYDLGFLYFSDNPPNVEKTREMWGKVVEISPDSSIAQTVASHLKSLDALASSSPDATGSAQPSAQPSSDASVEPSAAPASPAASPAASAGS